MANQNIKLALLILLLLALAWPAQAVAPPVRVKDIAHVLEARENQLMGFGLVVGLKNTGDSQQTGFTKQALTNLLSKMGITPQIDFKSRNAAAVMVTCNLPAFVKSGQKVDITVSSLGDATSLQGGTLLLTPLQGADGEIYAVAQGNVSVGSEQLIPNLQPIRQTRFTTGRIPDGALVEREIPVSIGDKGLLTIVLNEPDFTTANRLSEAILNLGFGARAQDAGTVVVAVEGGEDLVRIVSRIENITIRPDSVARVVINERTGTIVVGENVRLSEAAVAYGDITVSIGDVQLYSQSVADSSTIRSETNAKFKTPGAARLTRLSSSASLGALVRALNSIRATPGDLVAILQALKKAGALKAELEII
ncbi:MAG: flagellar basal body P-ring protein FlgI [Candidatus Margulisiibacteriota bacterium]